MVDPLQTGSIARATSEIAERLGLPLWFVELRHAATHEHLPGISVLREAAEQVNIIHGYGNSILRMGLGITMAV